MANATRWWPGSVVALRSVNDRMVKTACPMRVVRDDADLTALYLSPGTRYRA